MSLLKGMDSDNSEKKSYKRWSKSSDMNGVHKSLSVSEIENGFLIETSTYGDIDGKYMDDCKKYYSKTNPLSDDDLVLDNGLDKAITDFIKEI